MAEFSEQEAMAWASEHVDVESFSAVTRHPWARTYACSSGDRLYFLKASFNTRHKGGMHNLHLSKLMRGAVPAVVSVNPERGLILMEDFSATPCSESLNDAVKAQVLSSYGAIQVQCFGNDDMRGSLPGHTCLQTLENFIGLLRAAHAGDNSGQNPGNPFAYFSRSSRAGYLKVFEAIQSHLRTRFDFADACPPTINHCDLRAKNIALRADGSPIIFDWDDAIWAPPGFSLHAQFRGAHRVVRALKSGEGFENRSVARDREILESYLSALQEGPIGRDELRSCLQATAIAGVMHYISAFAPYTVQSRTSRSSIRKTVRRRISDLFDLFQDLAVEDEDFAQALAKAFDATGRASRAKKALAPWRVADLNPEKGLSFDMMPNADEKAAGAWSEVSLDAAVRLFQENGTLILRDVFEPQLIQACHAQVSEAYAGFQSDINDEGALRVGDRRYMVTPTLEGPLATPDLLASPYVLPVMHRLLSRKAVLGSVTSVISAPGAKDQSIHRDNPILFSEMPDLEVPNFLISLIVPLIPLTKDTGTTRLWPGSHRKHYSNYEDCPTLDPLCDVGSCYLMDSRLFHQGLANRSDKTRPILAIIYQRPWYVDHKNFKKQPPLRLADPTGKSLPEPVRNLVNWTVL